MRKVLAMAVAGVLGVCSVGHATEVDIAAAQRNFEGFYVGVNGGAVMQSDDFSVEGHINNVASRTDDRFQKGSGQLGVVIGGQKILGQFLGGHAYWAFEGGISKDFMKAQKNGALAYGGPVPFRIDSTFSKNSSFHIAQKFGLLFTECWGVYVKLGAVNTNFKYDLKSAAAVLGMPQLPSDSTRKNLWGFEVGLGAEYAMTEHWHANVEYVYQAYQHFNHKFEGARPGRHVTVNVGPKYHRVSMGLNYKF